MSAIDADAGGPRLAADPAEADLVRRARQGDQTAWEALVGRHQEPVFRLAYLILGDGAEAEDIAQEAFVRATLALGRSTRRGRCAPGCSASPPTWPATGGEGWGGPGRPCSAPS